MLLVSLSTLLPREVLPWLVRVVVLLAVLGMQVSAHAFLVDTDPRGGARKPVGPPQVLLTFSEPFAVNSQRVRLRTLSGKEVPLPPAQPTSGGRELTAPLPPLDEGVYVVEWQVLASDGHLSAGEFAFGVGNAGAVPTEALSNAQRVPWPPVVAKALLFLGLSLALGGLISERFVWHGARTRLPPAFVAAGLFLAVIGAVVQLTLLLNAEGVGGDVGWRVLSTHAGRVTLLTLACTVVAFLPRGQQRAWPVLAASVAASLGGHAGQQGGVQALLATVHFLAGAVWLGALAHFARVMGALRAGAWQADLPGLIARYARLAGWTLAPLLLAGVLLGVRQFTTPGELLGTAYGRTLLVKLGVVLGVLLLALIARLRALPASPGRLTLLRTVTWSEALLLGGVVVLSATLVTASPPRTLASAYTLGAPPLEGPAVRVAGGAGFLTVYAAATERQLQVQVLSPLGIPAEDARVSIDGRRPDGRGLTLYPRSCGRGCFEVTYDWPDGTTQLTIHANDPQGQGGRADLAVPWPPSADANARLERMVRTLRRQERLIVHEQATSGPNRRSYSYPIHVRDFLASDAHAGGGGVDVRELPGGGALTRLSLFVPGSNLWYEFQVDDHDRLRRQVIVAPGNQFERRIEYPDER
ncbi:copper resistance CopC family protein [Deinococcus peraridilitoris]|uniref:Putative copper export protein n=1 Tax=Deinococcus peraridilitoris (strain DSM 19664 / LMG 22246 / CIP 109416 / KR-200) TaxID=937777 RepID=L0A9A5_DEIPD|nr:copper resistance CopC family protein [Deinococcus peraridilitoris]AFZ69712.1 putative copper export protein [Deinococcus peraridilitoris DSM 19664]